MFDRQTFLVWTGFDKQNGARGWKHFGASLTVNVNVTLKSFETDDPKPTKESR